MKDPHVVRLNYKVRPGENVQFQQPPAVEWPTAEGTVKVDCEQASIELINHYSNEKDARAAVEPHLVAWEIWAGLTSRDDQRPFRFEFRKAELVDRAPMPNQAPSAQFRGTVTIPQSAALSRRLTSYPSPPQAFSASDEVQNMWYRWEQYRSNRETLPSVAYYCLTALEHHVGGGGRGTRV